MAEVPAIERPAGIVQVFAGNLEGAGSPAPYYSPLLGADVRVHPRQSLDIPLEPTFEHAVLVMSGDCVLDGETLAERMLYYLGTTRSDACFSSRARGTRAANRRPAVSGDDPHVVELRGADP